MGAGAATTIFESSGAKIIFGGLPHETFLETISRLIGTLPATQTSKSQQHNGAGRDTTSTSTSEREERRMKVEVIRRSPEGQTLLPYRQKKPSCILPDLFDTYELRAAGGPYN